MISKVWQRAWPYFLILIGSLLISWEVIGSILFDDTVVQDDFRQSMYWVWRFWDPNLFPNDFIANIYSGSFDRMPILYFIYKIAPYFTDNLIFYTKFIAIILAVITTWIGHKFFCALVKDSYTSLFFALSLTTLLWATDHLSAVQARSFIWLVLLSYMYVKNLRSQSGIFFVLSIALFLSPISFLICLSMEAISLFISFLNHTKPTRLEIIRLVFFIVLVFLVYKVLPLTSSQIPFPSAHFFTVDELKKLPEFNSAGRHPIFGDPLSIDSWWSNEHWGLGLGRLKVGKLVLFALISLFILGITNIKVFSSKLKNFISSQPCILFFSSLSLYFLAMILFPVLYMPQRYLCIPWLLLSLIIIFFTIHYIFSKNFQQKFLLRAVSVLVFFLCWSSFHIGRPAYYALDLNLKSAVESLPSDVMIAGDPRIVEISLIPAICKRKIFMSYEHSTPSFNEEILREVRRRNLVSFEMAYAKNSLELKKLMQENGVDYYIASARSYSRRFLTPPQYIEPYNNRVAEISSHHSFYLAGMLQEFNSDFLLVDVNSL